VLCSFEEDLSAAKPLARRLGVPCQLVECHHFPDGESRVRIDPRPERAIVFRSLHHPNEKLLELLLLASVLSDGARPILVAPYLPYMRQDAAFRPGEAVSQRIVGRLIADAFEAVVSVDPHLHRTASLETVFPGSVTVVVSAAPVLAETIRSAGGEKPLLVGPDCESEPLVAAVARQAGADHLVLDKTRRGDRDVSVESTRLAHVRGRRVVLIDDLVSTGATLIETAKLLREAGCTDLEALIVHALFDETAAAALAAAGIERIRSSDTIAHPTNAFCVAPLLAQAIGSHALLGEGPGGVSA
jgi:ribose-phosphate pyrophosphokinase